MSNPNLNSNKELLTTAEKEFENNIRPAQIDDLPANPRSSENLRIFIRAAKMRGEAPGSYLISWTSWSWKNNTFPHCGQWMGVSIKETSGPVIEKPGDLAGLLTNTGTQWCVVYWWDTPVEHCGGRISLCSDGGLPDRYYDWYRSQCTSASRSISIPLHWSALLHEVDCWLRHCSIPISLSNPDWNIIHCRNASENSITISGNTQCKDLCGCSNWDREKKSRHSTDSLMAYYRRVRKILRQVLNWWWYWYWYYAACNGKPWM